MSVRQQCRCVVRYLLSISPCAGLCELPGRLLPDGREIGSLAVATQQAILSWSHSPNYSPNGHVRDRPGPSNRPGNRAMLYLVVVGFGRRWAPGSGFLNCVSGVRVTPGSPPPAREKLLGDERQLRDVISGWGTRLDQAARAEAVAILQRATARPCYPRLCSALRLSYGRRTITSKSSSRGRRRDTRSVS